MPKNVDYLFIGGGLASATAAETLRREGVNGKISIISAENYLPYHRPPLTKHFLLGKQNKDRILIHKESFYRKNNIDVRLNTRAILVNAERKLVETDNAGKFRFKKLLIATGSCLSKLSVPGDDLSGIFYLRTISDAEAIKHALAGAKKAVVIGASFIAMELASSFTKMGIHVTIITKEEILFDKLRSPEISQFFTDYYKSHGVKVVFGESVRGFKGKAKVESVVTKSGKEFSCDFVAVGVGVTPETDFLKGSGIEINDGIIVNEYMQTNMSDIYAAGDVARFYDPVFRRNIRIEHWDNAVKQGRTAALKMIGKRQARCSISYFFSDVFDLTFNFLGDIEGPEERIVRGSIKDKSFSVLYLKDGVLRGTFLLRRPISEGRAADSLILNRVNLEKEKKKISDVSYPLENISAQNVLILQGGGALGAFECGVVKAMEEKGIYPDIVAGVSMGSFNAAIIAGNPKNAARALEAFWNDISTNAPKLPNEKLRRLISSWYVMMFGSTNFFHPRWLKPMMRPDQWPVNWTSFYDPSPIKDLLRKYVDFEKLKDSPTRLLVSAVNVETAELETFDSYLDGITPDHILASGSLPPGLPWTTINGSHYWDGGIVSNTPLDQVMALCGLTGKKVYIVNLYPRKKELPQNMMDIIARKDEIFYSEKISNDIHTIELIENYRKLTEEIMSHLEPSVAEQIKRRPRYIQTMVNSGPVSITRIIHKGEEHEPPSKDYDFSRQSIEEHIKEGYGIAKKTLDKESKLERNLKILV
ncbi:MAG: FAD-dependent oxidoreductase [Thermodesulfobacteriota bacterium]